MSFKKIILVSISLFICLYLYSLEISLLVKDGDLNISLESVHVYLLEQEFGLTDVNGRFTLVLPDEIQYPLNIKCTTPGYTDTSVVLKSKEAYTIEKPLVIVMGIDTVLEGNELVVEGKRPGKSDEKPGVSIVRTSEEMETTAQIGIVEDVMSSVSLLPGVGFKLGMNMEPSIRGGYPKEMGVTFDGVYLLEPFYWDGMVSILSPYMVDTVKLSTGIFSARYGQGTSGLLDTTSVKIGDAKKLTINISTISADVAAELPLGEKNDLFLYAHVTDLSTIKWVTLGIFELYNEINDVKEDLSSLNKTVNAMTYMPHIYSVYGKWNFKPVSEFSLTTNLLFAYDGISMELTDHNTTLDPEDPINPANYSLYPPYTSIYKLSYNDFQGLFGLQFDWMLLKTTLLHGLFSYTAHINNQNDHLYNLSWYGEIKTVYDENGNPMPEAIYTYTNDDVVTNETAQTQQIQGKIFSEVQVTDNSIIDFGIEEVFTTVNYTINNLRNESFWLQLPKDTVIAIPGKLVIDNSSLSGNNVLNSCAFVFWDYGSDNSLLKGEIGIRTEHFYLWNNNDNIYLNNYPVINPRFNLVFTPFRDINFLDTISFSAGSGLYSALSESTVEISKDALTDNFSLVPDTAWTSIIGSDVFFTNGIHISLEGYYKYYISRTYVYADKRDGENVVYHAGSDGQGFATGADVMVEKNISSWFDGYISYSFLYARFYNPASAQYESQTTTTGDPLEIWHYPKYHRFHTINTVLNFRLPKDCTLTLTGSFATGTPSKQYVDKIDEYLAGTFYDPGLNEYMYLELYSDVLRNLTDWPVDIRFSKKGSFRNPKYTWEWYVGVENLLGLLAYDYKIKNHKENYGFGESSGWTIGEGLLTIDMGLFPIPSFGIKMQF